LTRRNIPFVKFGGLKFLEAAHIKDVLAFLRWAENLRDRVSGFRVIQILPGAGPATAAEAEGAREDGDLFVLWRAVTGTPRHFCLEILPAQPTESASKTNPIAAAFY
jgi:superfamily I DNA/RNA helicase